MTAIHPTAMVDSAATIHDSVTIGPGAIIGPDVTIGEDCEIRARVMITGKTTIGPRCAVFPSAIIGIEPQDLSYNGEATETIIGSDNIIREFTTIHRGTPKGRGRTVVGNHNFMMANTHIAHDCLVGDHNIFSNVSTLAGHVTIGNRVNVGGLSAMHQFTRVGDYAFVGGCSALSQDVPPSFMASGNLARAIGVNRIGLSRNGYDQAQTRVYLTAFKILYMRNRSLKAALAEIKEQFPESPEATKIIEFIESSKRGIVNYAR